MGTEEEKNVGLKNKDVEVTMKIQGLLDKLKSKPISKNIAKSRTISGDSGISEREEDSDSESETDGDENMQVTTHQKAVVVKMKRKMQAWVTAQRCSNRPQKTS